MGVIEQELMEIKKRIKATGLRYKQFATLAGYDYTGSLQAFLNGQYKPSGESYRAHRSRIEQALRKAGV